MAVEVIGTGETYTTIGGWEADLATGSQTGQCKNESFAESVIINDADPSDITLEAASGAAHDGTPGNGARIVNTDAHQLLAVSVSNVVVRWLAWDANGASSAGNFVTYDLGGTAADVRHCLFRCADHDATDGAATGVEFTEGGYAVRCFAYDSTHANNFNQASLFRTLTTAVAGGIINCTGLNLSTTSTTFERGGIGFTDDADLTIQNNLIMTGSGASCYSDETISNATVSHNAADDTTATGTGSIDSVTPASEITSTTDGSEDPHLLTGAQSKDAGTDLGTTPTGVNLDIDNRDVDAQADTWDIGVDEFVSSGVVVQRCIRVGH